MGFKIFFHIILRTYQENISGIMLLLLRLLKIRLRRGFLINKYLFLKFFTYIMRLQIFFMRR